MISTPKIELARLMVKKKARPIIVKSQNPEFDRKMLEYGNFDILLSLESSENKDALKQTGSGLNEVMANIASKNKIAIGIDLKSIKCLDSREKAIVLGRIRQNIKICRKEKAKIILLDYGDKKNAFSFLISLGASTAQAEESLKSISF